MITVIKDLKLILVLKLNQEYDVLKKSWEGGGLRPVGEIIYLKDIRIWKFKPTLVPDSILMTKLEQLELKNFIKGINDNK